ncbi:MAG: STAS domain-containing protein [Gammaproteobacteria bacterium]|nr:STAS domain-containing protein [Gammaproteobacteria bacterium]MDE0412025.1 STAS domain-containing protein [Gammaproteobacteria bacterium]
MREEALSDLKVISVAGRIDGVTAQEFHEAINQEFLDPVQHVVMDFKELTYINSAGLRTVLLVAKELRKAGKKFKLCSLPEPVMQVVKTSGIDKVIDVCDDRSIAIAEISS